MDDRKERIMDDQTEVPPARDAESCDEPDGHGTGCLNRPGHDGPHRSRDRMWGGAPAGGPTDQEIAAVAERAGRSIAADADAAVLVADHRVVNWLSLAGDDRFYMADYAERIRRALAPEVLPWHKSFRDWWNHPAATAAEEIPAVEWPPAEWRAPASVTVPQDLTARLDALERTVENLAARLDALDGAAATAAEALRQHISEQASFTRRHVSVVLGTHVTRIEELIRERDIVPEEPAVGPCTATAQSPTGLVTCMRDEGHTGSHTNALAVWSDAPPVPPGGVYEVY